MTTLTSPPAVLSHRFFSPGRVWALAINTLTELIRQKIFYFLLIFALFVIGNSAFMENFSFEQEFQMLKDVSLGAMSIFTSLIAMLATAFLLPKDIEDRTLYTLLAKPVPRYEYLLGKLLGVMLLLFLSVLLMSALFVAVLAVREQMVLSETYAQLKGAPPADISAAILKVKSSALNINLLPGIIIIFIKASLLVAMTLLISTFASSGIFTAMVAMAVYFIGHMQATARDYWLQSIDASWVTRVFLAIVALFFPDFQAFNLIDGVVVGTAIPFDLFMRVFALGIAYIVVYYFLAAFIFSGKEL
ncbi:MAG: ABC transporter permease subunit [Chthoniobacterales bacterium]